MHRPRRITNAPYTGSLQPWIHRFKSHNPYSRKQLFKPSSNSYNTCPNPSETWPKTMTARATHAETPPARSNPLRTLRVLHFRDPLLVKNVRPASAAFLCAWHGVGGRTVLKLCWPSCIRGQCGRRGALLFGFCGSVGNFAVCCLLPSTGKVRSGSIVMAGSCQARMLALLSLWPSSLRCLALSSLHSRGFICSPLRALAFVPSY
jgi:hypothetical protein